jgi:hypothetical protein
VGGKHGRGRSRRGEVAIPAEGKSKLSRATQATPEAQPAWKRALGGSVRWVGGLITAAVIAAVTAAVTVVVTQHAAVAKNTTVRHGPPVKVDSVTVLRTAQQAGIYTFQRTVKLSRPDLQALNRLQGDTAAYDAWFRRRGGVDPSQSHVQLVVEGNANQPARIINITVIKSCQAPLTGTLFDNPPAAGQPALPISFDLDSPQSIAQSRDGHDYFPMSTIVLKPGEEQVIEITATAVRHYCRYSLELTVLVGNHTTTENVTNDGEPFLVSALYKSPRYHALYAGGVVSPDPTGDFVQERPGTDDHGR